MPERDRPELGLERIEAGSPEIIEAVWRNFPSPYEIDMGDEAAIKRLLAAIAAAARRPQPASDRVPTPSHRP